MRFNHFPPMVIPCCCIVQCHTPSIGFGVVKNRKFASPSEFLMLYFNSRNNLFFTPLSPLANINPFSISIIVSFQENCINTIIGYVTFCDYLFSLNQNVWRLIQVVASINSAFVFTA